MLANSLLLWSSHVSSLSHKMRLSTSWTVAFSELSPSLRSGPGGFVGTKESKVFLFFPPLPIESSKIKNLRDPPSVFFYFFDLSSLGPCDVARGRRALHPTKLGAVTRTMTNQMKRHPE